MSWQLKLERSVSRETLEALRHYEAQLLKWTKRVNLISKSTIPHVWERHILDSLQIWPLVQKHKGFVDLGSGGGLPGIVLAVCSTFEGNGAPLTMIESDARKATFLRQISLELGLPATVKIARIEEAEPEEASIAIARALADIKTLASYAYRHTTAPHTAIFPKGKLANEELEKASQVWSFSVIKHPSKTSDEGVIVQLSDIRPR